jgi:acyl-CoA synthetase (AMP-forming)/AMP-acid ligase II
MGVTAIKAPGIGRVRSLPELLERRAHVAADQRAYTFLEDGEREGDVLTWGELARRSAGVASAIAGCAAPGARALILCPPGLDFVPAFFGSLAAATIAVPCYPPRGGRALQPDGRDRAIDRLQAIVRDARPSVVLAPRAIIERRSAVAAIVPELDHATWIETDSGPLEATDTFPAVEPSRIAFLQYTSGSTAEPRGVMVTHANLLHNLADAHHLARHSPASASVSWLPVIHDMGLIQGMLQAVFSGFPAWLMSPAAFLQRPARWLQAISRVGATISGGPNFAYELCTRRISPEERAALDLRSWRLAFNGAEPIRQETLDGFARAFAGCGFDRRAFRPSYGLAEATLLVTTGRGATTSCGIPAATTDVRIVDPETRRECPAGGSGEIWVAGPGVADGYWNQPALTVATFGAWIANTGEGPFLRSGDMGSLHPDGLHVTGRIKDLLIVRGVKHHPQDIEHTVESASSTVRTGCCAVFALPGTNGDLVGVAAEIDGARRDPGVEGDAIVSIVREAVGSGHGIQVSMVALVAPGTIPKTTSGKLQRFACREGLLSGRLSSLFVWTDTAAQLAMAS